MTEANMSEDLMLNHDVLKLLFLLILNFQYCWMAPLIKTSVFLALTFKYYLNCTYVVHTLLIATQFLLYFTS